MEGRNYFFYSAFFFVLLTKIFATALENASCLEQEESLTLIERLEILLTNATNAFPSCKEDVNSENGSECCGQKFMPYIELSTKLVSDLRKSIPTCSKPDDEGNEIDGKDKRDKKEKERVEIEREKIVKEKQNKDKKREKKKKKEKKREKKERKEKERKEKEEEEKKNFGNCAEIFNNGSRQSGVYTIFPREPFTPGKSLQVYCDMETDRGGWMVIQRRRKVEVQQDFYQDWKTYKKGFGNLREEFWLGNENIRALCYNGCQLRIDLHDAEGKQGYGLYNSFSLSNEEYRISISGYSGEIGDSMYGNDNVDFSAKDRGLIPFANYLKSGWWIVGGHYYCNLNGLYLPGQVAVDNVHWFTWRGWNNLRSVEMKVRQK